MEKHDKGCKKASPSSITQQTIVSFRSTNNENDQHLICLNKRKITNTMTGDGFRVLVQDLTKAGQQFDSNVSVNELETDKIYTIHFWTEQYTKVSFGDVALYTYSSSHGLLVFLLTCRPYDLPDQTANNIRVFTNCVLESYDLKRDLFAFWERQNDLYPFLYLIARDVLIVSATNTAVERLFSASENSVTEARTRLSAQKVDKLMFLKKIFDDSGTTPLLIINSGTTASK
ncbi:unnamed protein product, partial [Rotaria sordida]